MTSERLVHNRRGAALFMTLLVAIAVAGVALGGILLASGAQLSTRYNAKEALMQSTADGGLELVRDSINRGIFDSLLPDSGFTTLASHVPVTDASGNVIPRMDMSLYVGRTGGRTGGAATAGQYGSNFASALSVISDPRGAVAVRRLLLTQESWSKFAVAINNWSGGAMYGCGESVNGPFFSNTNLIVQSGCGIGSGTLFASTVNVVGTIQGDGGRYTQGYHTGVTPVPWPTPARIALMRQYAASSDASNGDYDLTSLTSGANNPGLRIEFVTIDVNGNGVIDWDEGFMRVWVPANTSDSALAYATGRRWPTGQAGVNLAIDPNMASRNCGSIGKIVAGDPIDSVIFHSASDVYARSASFPTTQSFLTAANHRCYLGGDPHLFRLTSGDTLTPDLAAINPGMAHAFGTWKTRRLGPLPALTSVRSGDKAFLIPLGANPNFKGVIYVNGDVALSGRVRGRVSVFATGNIVMADDLLYQNPPGTNCSSTGDIFGAIATKNVVIEDNNLQTPFVVNNIVFGGYDDTNDANYNMFFLAAGDGTTTLDGSSTGNWYGEGDTYPVGNWWPYYTMYNSVGGWDASATGQSCGSAVNGCVRVTGGLAQGRVDDFTYYGGGLYGWAEAHTYDKCGSINPPPYFPTTGRFIPSRYYEIDPVWMNNIGIGSYFNRLQSQ